MSDSDAITRRTLLAGAVASGAMAVVARAAPAAEPGMSAGDIAAFASVASALAAVSANSLNTAAKAQLTDRLATRARRDPTFRARAAKHLAQLRAMAPADFTDKDPGETLRTLRELELPFAGKRVLTLADLEAEGREASRAIEGAIATRGIVAPGTNESFFTDVSPQAGQVPPPPSAEYRAKSAAAYGPLMMAIDLLGEDGHPDLSFLGAIDG